MKKTVEHIKAFLMLVRDYYNTLPIYGKILFVVILILCKIGPDMITVPLLLKWIQMHKVAQ